MAEAYTMLDETGEVEEVVSQYGGPGYDNVEPEDVTYNEAEAGDVPAAYQALDDEEGEPVAEGEGEEEYAAEDEGEGEGESQPAAFTEEELQALREEEQARVIQALRQDPSLAQQVLGGQPQPQAQPQQRQAPSFNEQLANSFSRGLDAFVADHINKAQASGHDPDPYVPYEYTLRAAMAAVERRVPQIIEEMVGPIAENIKTKDQREYFSDPSRQFLAPVRDEYVDVVENSGVSPLKLEGMFRKLLKANGLELPAEGAKPQPKKTGKPAQRTRRRLVESPGATGGAPGGETKQADRNAAAKDYQALVNAWKNKF